MGCSDPQGPGHGRESINPAKMQLCPAGAGVARLNIPMQWLSTWGL